jgi:disulfide bond formation protein DsbB
MKFLSNSRWFAALGCVICIGLIAFALYLQYGEHLEPCPLCMMQRIAFAVLAVGFFIMALHAPGRTGALVYAVLLFVTSATGIGLASRHVWLQWFPPPVSVCDADLFFQLQRFPWLAVVQKALRATGDCAKVDWTLFGLSIAQWSWLWFVALTVAIGAFAYARLRSPRAVQMA